MLTFLFHLILFFLGKTRLFDFQKFLCENNSILPQLWTVHGDINNFNVALPDSYASYEGSFICINTDETIIIEGNVPNARYFSFQVYDSTTASLGSLNDYQIKLNSSEKFVINISKLKKCDLEQDANTLYISTDYTFLLVIFRLYDIEKEHKLKLPDIKKKFNGEHKYFEHALTYQKVNFPRLYRNTKPVREHRFANEDNNFFKPIVKTFFHNGDTDYLVSLIVVNQSNPIGAIITGHLPETNFNKNINNDFFKNNFSVGKYYDVRYVSFNMGILSSPLPTIAGDTLLSSNNKKISSSGTPGIIDEHIVNKYNNNNEWILRDRPYIIYVGGTIEQIKSLGGDPDRDLYMLYPKMYDGKYFTYVSILHRHLMPQIKMFDKPMFNQSISDIVGNPVEPLGCEKIMGKYYPKIKFVNNE